MKKIYRFLLGGAVGSALLMSCFDAKDFDFDKLNYDNLNPQFHLPLLTDTLYISDAIEGDDLQFIDGQGYFVFDVGNIEMPDVSNLFELPDQNVPLDMDLPLPDGIRIPAGIPFHKWTYSDNVTADIDFGAADIEPKSIKFSGGTLTLTNTHPFPAGTLTVKITNLTKGATTFTADINVTSTTPVKIPLADYTMTVGADKKLMIVYTYKTDEFTTTYEINDISLGFNLQISNIAIGEARGYFGQHTEYAENTIDIGDFSDINGSWALKEAEIILNVQNSIEVPLRVAIETIKSYTAGTYTTWSKVDSIDITASTVTKPYTLHIPGDVLSKLPEKIDVTVKVQSNPNGKTADDNVISSTSSASANAEIKVPLKVKNINITLTDTVDFDASDISFNNLGLLLNVQNSLPLGVKLQCMLLKKGTNQSLGNLLTEPVEIPAGNTTPVAGTNDESKVTSPSETHKFIAVKDDMAKKFKEADRIIVSFAAFTNPNDTRFVRITEDDNVSLKIGVSAGINVGDIKDKL